MKKRMTVVMAAVLIACTLKANVSELVVSPSTTFPNYYDPVIFTDGFGFTVGSNSLLVTALGFYDKDENGLNFSYPVGLWSADGTLLGSVTVPAGTSGTLTEDYRYARLHPLRLSAGSSYVIGAFINGSNHPQDIAPVYFPPKDAYPFDSGITDIHYRSTEPGNNGSSGLTFPLIDEGSGAGFIGPNAKIVVLSGGSVPESLPTFWLGLTAAGLFAFAHLRRKRA